MKINRLASVLSLTMLTATASYAARYQIIELPLKEQGRFSFGADLNDGGDAVALVQQPFNPPIDIELINFDDENLVNALTDPSAAENGIFNSDDLQLLYSFIKQADGSQFAQQIGDIESYVYDGSEVQIEHGLDVLSTEFQGYTRSTEIQVNAINNSSALAGISGSPYYKLEFQNEQGTDFTYILNEFNSRAFITIAGQSIPIVPPEDTLGGESLAYDINNSFEVVGSATVEVSDSLIEAEESCDEEETRGDIPVEACLSALRSSSTFTNGFKRRGMIWQFDSSGNLLEERELGIAIDVDEDDTRLFSDGFSSRATAINDNGIAVGTTVDYFRDDENVVRTYAAAFDGDEVISFSDRERYTSSLATDINNSDIVVGGAARAIAGVTRNKFFIHDLRGELTTFPDDFFDSSASIARAINDSGLVVGDGEVDASLSGNRRREAFIYDIESDTFENLNDLVACNSPYTIVEAQDINNNGEIIGTATVFRDRTNISGEEDLDDQGNTIPEGTAVAVKLIPIPGGSADNCSDQEESYERSDGSLPLWLACLLVPLTLLRRKI